MKNMFDGKSDAYALKACLEAIDAFADSMLKQQIAADKGAVLNMNFDVDKANNFAIMYDSIEKISTKARADRFKDMITRTIGLFDEEMTELNAKKSDLLAKDNVQHYTYKHHIWRAAWYSVEIDNIYAVLNHVLDLTQFVVHKEGRTCSAAYAKEIVDKEYKSKVDGYIETRLCGWAKGAYEKYLTVNMLGDGKKEVIKEFNFQDDWSVSDMLDWEQKITKDALESNKKVDLAVVKDNREKLKKIMKDFHDMASTDKGNAKLYADEIKRCVKYTTYLTMRLDEFMNATYRCMTIQRDEIHKVLKGLLEYNGD
jgi:hypothetical protein